MDQMMQKHCFGSMNDTSTARNGKEWYSVKSCLHLSNKQTTQKFCSFISYNELNLSHSNEIYLIEHIWFTAGVYRSSLEFNLWQFILVKKQGQLQTYLRLHFQAFCKEKVWRSYLGGWCEDMIFTIRFFRYKLYIFMWWIKICSWQVQSVLCACRDQKLMHCIRLHVNVKWAHLYKWVYPCIRWITTVLIIAVLLQKCLHFPLGIFTELLHPKI